MTFERSADGARVRALTTLLSMVSHDAANPLQGLHMTLALTREDHEDNPELCKRIDSALEATLAMREILAGAGTLANALAKGPTDGSLRALAGTLGGVLQPRFERRGLRFEVELDPDFDLTLPGPVANAIVWLVLATTLPAGAGLDGRARRVMLSGRDERVALDVLGEDVGCRFRAEPLADARALLQSAGWTARESPEFGLVLHPRDAS